MYIQKISVKFGRVVFEIREQRDRHTDTVIAIPRTPAADSWGGEVTSAEFAATAASEELLLHVAC